MSIEEYCILPMCDIARIENRDKGVAMIHVIYHANCADGFGAAMVARDVFGTVGVNYTAASYQEPPPDVTGQDVIILDFSYKASVILEMCKKAQSIKIIDHHLSTINDLAGLDSLASNLRLCLDQNYSGAMLAWRHFIGEDHAPPKLLEYIQDRDLWRFELPNSREVSAALFSYPYDFALWRKFYADHGNDTIDCLAREGAAILRKQEKDLAELIPQLRSKMIIAGQPVPVVNLPYTLASEAGHILARNEIFAASYYITQVHWVFSLRSSFDGIDVSEVAQKFGGGGHRHASGFKIAIFDPSDTRNMNERLAYPFREPSTQENDE